MIYADKYYNTTYNAPVFDQGSIGSCVPNAIVSSLYNLMNQAGHAIPILSRLQMYYDGREALDAVNQDIGNVAAIDLFLAMDKGVVPEWMWGYDVTKVFVKPPAYLYDVFAPDYKVSYFTSINVTQTSEQIKNNVLNSLSEGKTIITSFKLRDFFNDAHGDLSQQIAHGNGTILGNHAVEIVGYDSSIDGGSYIVKNSWGENWGDGGYGVISYKQFGSDSAYGSGDLMAMQVVQGMKVNGTLYDMTYTNARVDVNEVYVAVLGRAADLTGMDWHVNNNLYAVVHRENLMNQMIDSVEGTILFGNKTNEQFVDMMYENILGRHAEEAGVDYWTSVISSGVSKGEVANYILTSAENPSGEGYQLFANKVNLANYISISKQYSGGHDAEIAQALDSVTANVDALEIIKIGLSADWNVG